MNGQFSIVINHLHEYNYREHGWMLVDGCCLSIIGKLPSVISEGRKLGACS